MPFDSLPTETRPDLTVPSLEGLAWLLRHRDEWPKGFRWNWLFIEECAIGLAHAQWPQARITTPSFSWAHYRGRFSLFRRRPRLVIPDEVAWGLGVSRYGVYGSTTPNWAADILDCWLKENSHAA